MGKDNNYGVKSPTHVILPLSVAEVYFRRHGQQEPSSQEAAKQACSSKHHGFDSGRSCEVVSANSIIPSLQHQLFHPYKDRPKKKEEKTYNTGGIR